jgi:DNA-directed RNA polymerase specialized sigma24 family protein
MFVPQMGGFRRLSEAELAKLDEGELVAYAVSAREAGTDEETTRALRIFAFGMEDAVRAFVRTRLDTHGDAVIEEVAERALEDAIRSIEGLRGGTAAEARAFVFKIARLRIADFHRSARGRAGPAQELPGEEAAPAGSNGSGEGSESDAIDTSLVFRQAMEELRPDHRIVVERCVVMGYSAREAVEHLAGRFDGQIDDSMTEQNVHQICSRFRRELRARLEAGGRVS